MPVLSTCSTLMWWCKFMLDFGHQSRKIKIWYYSLVECLGIYNTCSSPRCTFFHSWYWYHDSFRMRSIQMESNSCWKSHTFLFDNIVLATKFISIQNFAKCWYTKFTRVNFLWLVQNLKACVVFFTGQTGSATVFWQQQCSGNLLQSIQMW